MKKAMYYIIMLLSLITAVIAVQYLPERIPVHYGVDNQVTRWGSRNEIFIMPVVNVVMGLCILASGKYLTKQEKDGNNNEKVTFVTGILLSIMFNILNGYFIYTAFNQVENLSDVPIDVWRLFFGFFGVFMVVVGNIQPKLRMNSIIGLRTIWSMKDETTWKKSQRFGGISFVIGGIILIGICFLTKGLACFFWAMGILAVVVIADVYYTYRVAHKKR